MVLKELSVWFREAPRRILDDTDSSKPGGTWFPGALLNISECCLLPTSYPRKMDNSLAIVWREEGADDLPVCQLTLKQLREQVMYAQKRPSFMSFRHIYFLVYMNFQSETYYNMVCRLVANALDATFAKGDVIAIDMQMTPNAVIIYLAIILSGRIVVSIADSFAAKEIATRLRISKAKGIFTQVIFCVLSFTCAAPTCVHCVVTSFTIQLGCNFHS